MSLRGQSVGGGCGGPRALAVALALLLPALASPTLARDESRVGPEPFSGARPAPADLVDGRLVGLKATGFFDPVAQRPDFEGLIPQRPPGLPERTGLRRYFLVQFERPVTPADRARLQGSGSTVIGPLRNQALVVGVPPRVSETGLRALPGVRYVGPFLPGYKLDIALAHLLNDGTSTAGAPHRIDVELFPGESPGDLVQAFASRFGESRVRPTYVRRAKSGRFSRVTFEIAGSALNEAVGLLLNLSSVAYVRRLAPPELYNDNALWVGQSYDRVNGPAEALAVDPKPYTESATLWSHGLIGTGQIVAVADTGLDYSTCFWEDSMWPVSPQQVDPPGALTLSGHHRKILAVNGVNSFTLDYDGTFRHGTHVSATVAGDDLAHLATGSDPGHDHGDGMAPGARIIFEDIGGPQNYSCTTSLYVDSLYDILEQEYNAGARVSTNSWGTAMDWPDDVDAAVWDHEDLLVIFSTGNDGTNGINETSTNKNGVGVGASENYDGSWSDALGILDPENMTSFSSHGPAADGRLKPDIAAPGYNVYSNRYPTQWISNELDPQCTPSDPDIDVCFPGFGGCYLTFTADSCPVNELLGTSMAAPTVAGLATLARQYFTDGYHPGGEAEPADAVTPSAALLKAVLINGARNMTGGRYDRRGGVAVDYGPLADAPSNVQGWGRVMLDDALYFPGDTRRVVLVDVANADGLATSESAALDFNVSSTGEPLKVTLVWTDPPAPSYASAALINDLDLELLAPDGTIYRGNQWTADDVNVPGDKVSLPDAAGKDALNNVEGILVPAPQVGLYTVTVQASSVPGYMGLLTQGYALVITGVVSTSPGAVPGGEAAPGTPLTVEPAAGTDITLTWDVSCLPLADDYEIYEGVLGDFSSHTSKYCTTGGATTKTFTPATGNRYYLVVPRTADDEGSYGVRTGGSERPVGLSPCVPQNLGPCP